MNPVVFYATLFVLGAAHGLEPGHGKLLVTSYLTGSNARTRDAVLLGLLVALFHTLSVGLIGALVVFLAFAFFKDTFVHSLEILSGVAILCLGLLLFWRRFIGTSKNEEHCDCHLLHATPMEAEKPAPKQASLKEVILLALASGVTPCPVALSALILAFAMGKSLAALGSLAVFSLGIGSVLVVLGLVLIKGTQSLQYRWEKFRLAPVYISKVSTVIVLLLGVYLVAKPLLYPDDDHNRQAQDTFHLLMPGTIR